MRHNLMRDITTFGWPSHCCLIWFLSARLSPSLHLMESSKKNPGQKDVPVIPCSVFSSPKRIVAIGQNCGHDDTLRYSPSSLESFCCLLFFPCVLLLNIAFCVKYKSMGWYAFIVHRYFVLIFSLSPTYHMIFAFNLQ